jgi:hypothetical protein
MRSHGLGVQKFRRMRIPEHPVIIFEGKSDGSTGLTDPANEDERRPEAGIILPWFSYLDSGVPQGFRFCYSFLERTEAKLTEFRWGQNRSLLFGVSYCRTAGSLWSFRGSSRREIQVICITFVNMGTHPPPPSC